MSRPWKSKGEQSIQRVFNIALVVLQKICSCGVVFISELSGKAYKVISPIKINFQGARTNCHCHKMAEEVPITSESFHSRREEDRNVNTEIHREMLDGSSETDSDSVTEDSHLRQPYYLEGNDTSENMARSVSLERIREETRLVVLDFLSSLPPEKLTARNLSNSEKRPKYSTKGIRRLSKSASDASTYEFKRRKFLRMAQLQRKLSLNLKQDIESFDRRNLKVKRPNNLQIPQSTSCLKHSSSPVLSPEGHVASRLEKISQEIMEKLPHLLDEPLEIMRGGSLSYKQFSEAARKLTFHDHIVGWSKVALLCHFAREIAMVGELDDKQLELLADYSFRFIQESTEEWINNQGGWAAFETEDEHDILNTDILLEKYWAQEEKDGHLPTGKECMQRKRDSRINSNRNSWDSWLKYGVAAVAVGIGVCYSLIKQ